MPCPDEETVLAFLAGRLNGPTLAQVDTHFGGCVACRDLLAAAAPIVLGARRDGAMASSGAGGTIPTAAAGSALASPHALMRGASMGRYVILDLVGRGGMGEVYAAYDPELDRRIALKLLHDDAGAGSRNARARLLREAQAIARLSHPNVVVVYDVGTIDDRVFIARELVDGQTLAEWLGGRARRWNEIKDVFLAAGRGLAAAHAAGLVHRDFKPQNVMVARDGGVRVMDFGLASASAGAADEPADDEAPRPDVSAPGAGARTVTFALTRTGTLIGTPAYMAREQFLAKPVDARTDQFSFCVALYEALYGERPFDGASLAVLADAVVNGRLREPPPRNRVAAWLRKVILRGLRPKGEDRFPTMRALLAALERDPARRRRRVLLALATAGLLIGGGALVDKLVGQRGAALCGGGGMRLSGAWETGDDPGPRHLRRDGTRAAFLATGRANAAATWQHVATLLDNYARAWAGMYRDACEATHVRGEQSAEVLDLRMDCLGRNLQNLRALTDVFLTADGAVVTQAVNAASSLPELARCADVPVLRAVVPPPRDPAARRQVETLRRRAAEVRALGDAGRWTQGLARARPLLDESRTLGYDPATAEVYSLIGWLQEKGGDPRTAQKSYAEALWAAEAARHDEVAAEAAIELSGLSSWELVNLDEGRAWGRLADSILKRMGPGHERLQGWLAHNRGLASLRAGKLATAQEEFRRAMDLKERAEGSASPDLAASLNALGLSLGQQGDLAGALAATDRALEIYDRAHGRGSELAALSLNNRGDWLSRLGRSNEALDAYHRSLADLEDAVGRDHRWLAAPLTGSGAVLLALHRPAEAVPLLTRALDLRRRLEPDLGARAETRFLLARALWDSGQDRARARPLATASRDEYRQTAGAGDATAAIEAWLGQHPPAGKSRRP